MTDFTYDIAALEDAKFALRKVKSDIRAEEEHKALVAARVRIAERHREADYAFAKELAAAAAKGIPQTILRKKVIKTNDWDTWKYWRDLAEIEPERISVSNAKAAAKERAEAEARTHEFKDGVLYWYKWNDGTTMESPFVINDYSTSSDFVYIPEALVLPLRDYGYKEFYNSATKAVRDAFTRGIIEPKERASKRYQAMEISTEEYAAFQAEGERLNEAWADYKEGDKS